MAARPKLSDADVKRIRRRVRAGAHRTDLADEYGVNRKTIWRRLAELERAEKEHAERLAAKRLRWQAKRERRKLHEREQGGGLSALTQYGRPRGSPPARQQTRRRDPHHAWLDRPKNLSGRALSEASGLVRVRKPDGTIRKWVERSEVEAMFDAGWVLDDPA